MSGHFPAGAVRFFEELVRLRSVGSLHCFGFPINLLLYPQSDQSEQPNFGQSRAVAEIGAGGGPAFAGVEPIAMMPFGKRQANFGPFVFGVFSSRQKSRATSPTRASKEAFVANEQRPVAIGTQLIIFLESFRARGHQAAFVPGKLHWRPFAMGGTARA